MHTTKVRTDVLKGLVDNRYAIMGMARTRLRQEAQDAENARKALDRKYAASIPYEAPSEPLTDRTKSKREEEESTLITEESAIKVVEQVQGSAE